MTEITLDQLALVLPGCKDLYYEWQGTEDNYDIDSVLVGFLAAHEGLDYELATKVFETHILPLFDSWDQELEHEKAGEVDEIVL
jgi:hypothetical protein